MTLQAGGLKEDRAPFEEYIVYLSNHKAVACVPCGFCPVPGPGTKRHLKDFHQNWPLQVRKDIIKHVTQLPLARPEDVLPPSFTESAITGLTLHDGWRCQKCQYCSPSEGTILEHCKKGHKWTKAHRSMWKPAKVQTFFVGSRRHFFQVEAISSSTEKGDCHADLGSAVHMLLEQGRSLDEQEAKEAAKVDDDQLAIDTTPWMKKTRWGRKFAGRDLLAITALSHKPTKDEGSLMMVWESVHRVMERCRASIVTWHDDEEDGDVVLGWLNSSQVGKCNPDPFSVYYQRSTHVKYTNWFAQGVCYLLRLLYCEDQHGHRFTSAEEDALHKIWDTVELGGADEAALDSSVLDLSVLLWMHEGRAHSKSAIIHFSAVLGIDPHKGCYRLPPVYGQILAALLYCARLVLFEHALPAASRQYVDSPCEQFLEVHHQWLVDGRPTPFNYLNNLLAYALGAGKDVGGKPRVQWSGDRQTLIYQGQRLPLSDLRRFANEICTAAEELLYCDLMFLSDPAEASPVDLKALVDDMNETAVGYSFVSDPRNSLVGGRESMLQRLIACTKARSLVRSRDGKIEVHPEKWRKYRLQLQNFLGLLYLLVHINDVARRGVELIPVRYANAPQNPRNIFVYDGQVMIATGYDKTQAMTGHQKVIARFLGHRVSQLVVKLLVDVFPFTTLVDREHIPRAARCFLWADRNGIWKTPQVTKTFVAETSMRLSFRITLQDYRHIGKAIDREHVRGIAADLEGDVDDVHDLAFAHSTNTADNVYGIDASMLRSLNSRTLQAFRAVSNRWHQFWRLDDQERSGGKIHGRALSNTAALPDAKRRLVCSDPAAEFETALKQLLGPEASFRSGKQKQALLAIRSGSSPLVVVLPPGGGKSLLFQLPASLPGAATTIVVLPFRALTQDLIKRCRQLGIRCSLWNSKEQPSAPVIFVGAETAAVNDDFLTFASELQTRGVLDRIVVDECQVPLTSLYRHRLVHLDRLRAIPCQLVLLTGTLPPRLESVLEDNFLLGTKEQGLRYIRSSTNRSNVEYNVEVVCGNDIEDRVCKLVQQLRSRVQTGEKVVVFCRSRTICERLAQTLGCQAYHRTLAEKEESLATWIDGLEQVMIATSALGTGIDVNDIRFVVHMDRPHGIMDYVQEVGRSGRDGENVRSIVVLGKSVMKWLRSEAAVEKDWNREGIRLFLTEEKCRRLRLSAIMDGEEIVCGEQGGRKCDLCSGHESEAAVLTGMQKRSRAEEQEEKYAVGPQLWQARVRHRARQRQLIEWAVADIGPQCAACWLYQEAERSHRPENCPVLDKVVGREYWTKRRSIRFETACFCCYHCSLPGDWCPWYSQGQKCTQADVITPIVLAGWASEGVRGLLEQEVGGSEADCVVRWMGKATLIGGTRAPNGVRAAETIIRMHRRS